MSLSRHLEILPLEQGPYSLKNLVKIAGVKPDSHRKASLVKALDEFLSVEENLKKIWQGLPPVERELLETFLRMHTVDLHDILSILSKYQDGPLPRHRNFLDYFPPNSRVRLFFLGYGMPQYISETLSKMIKPLEIAYTEVPAPKLAKVLQDDDVLQVEVGESFATDCLNLIKLANSTKLRTTKGSGLPTKAAMQKINEALVNQEILFSFGDIEDFRVFEQTVRLYGLTQLLLSAKVLQNCDGLLEPGPGVDEFLMLNPAGKCLLLLEKYIEAEDIFELDRTKRAKFQAEYRSSLTEARNTVLWHLSSCPVNTWVDFFQLKRYIKALDYNFLFNLVGAIGVYNPAERYFYYSSSWQETAGEFIEVMLLEYLNVLGLVDLVVEEGWDEFTDKTFPVILYLRLTPLGAYVLGVNDDYPEPAAKQELAGLIIQPNFEIVVSSDGSEDAHLLFLDRFAEKISEGPANIYKLNFKTIVNALEQHIPVQEFIDYFQEFSLHPIPENVLLTLEEWKEESQKIRIRTATILEVDNEYLLEELKSYKTIQKHIRQELPHVLEVEDRAAQKLKREIEKKKRFCLDERD